MTAVGGYSPYIFRSPLKDLQEIDGADGGRSDQRRKGGDRRV